jgi:hypothetical protein
MEWGGLPPIFFHLQHIIRLNHGKLHRRRYTTTSSPYAPLGV